MDFELTLDQREIQGLTRELALAEIVPNAPAWDRDHRFPDDLYPKLAELGLWACASPRNTAGLVRTSSRTSSFSRSSRERMPGSG